MKKQFQPKGIIYCIIFFLACSNFSSYAQEFNSTVPKKIVILNSSKDYATAKKIAIAASKKMKRQLKISDLSPNKKFGLTMSKTDCESFGYPCYIARGEGDATNSNYISIEYSNAYEGFTKGFYIVVACVSDPKSKDIETTLKSAKRFYKSAYAKSTKVWYGCMH